MQNHMSPPPTRLGQRRLNSERSDSPGSFEVLDGVRSGTPFPVLSRVRVGKQGLQYLVDEQVALVRTGDAVIRHVDPSGIQDTG